MAEAQKSTVGHSRDPPIPDTTCLGLPYFAYTGVGGVAAMGRHIWHAVWLMHGVFGP